VQDEGDRDVLRLVVGVEQEVGMQVDLAVVLDVETGRSLRGQSGFCGSGKSEAEVIAHPEAHFGRWRHQVHPDRLDAGEVRLVRHFHLAQPAILEFKGVQGKLSRSGGWRN